MKTFKQCKFNYCFGIAEYTINGIDACLYHFLKRNDDIWQDGKAQHDDNFRWLHEHG